MRSLARRTQACKLHDGTCTSSKTQCNCRLKLHSLCGQWCLHSRMPSVVCSVASYCCSIRLPLTLHLFTLKSDPNGLMAVPDPTGERLVNRRISGFLLCICRCMVSALTLTTNVTNKPVQKVSIVLNIHATTDVLAYIHGLTCTRTANTRGECCIHRCTTVIVCSHCEHGTHTMPRLFATCPQ